MKAKDKYYFRKQVKQGKDFIMKDVQFDPFNIINENGKKLGDLFEELESKLKNVDKKLLKIDKFIKGIGGLNRNEED